MIMVTGASGTVGRELLRELAATQETVLAVSRSPNLDNLPGNAKPIAADLSDPTSVAHALGGVESVFLNPAAIEGSATELLSLLREHGTPRIVLLSALTVEHPAGEERFAERFRRLERCVADSGLGSTILRSSDFDGNVRLWAPQIRMGGIVRAPYADARTSPVHERDLAAIAAKALLDSAHAGRTYTLTGPDSLDQRQKAAIIGEAIGSEVVFEELTPEQARAGMLEKGVPAEIVDRLLGSLADYAVAAGPTTVTVAELLDRPVLTFADWAAANAAMFRP
ncbi:MAG: NAD(P)H-binding protein [Actinobacteria bacterium]|nr:NAD(P)H-binding protein [Actinomycetota bacterium]